jgi:hypothetical protein
MRDRPIIYAGLFVFLALFTFPVWRNLAANATTKGPQQVVPVNAKECVAPIAYMRKSHMTLLYDWRDQVVRNNNRQFTAYNGKTYTRSLTKTCLECHGPKADFCERCHTYASVSITCWNCHVDVGRTSVRAGLQSRFKGSAQ